MADSGKISPEDEKISRDEVRRLIKEARAGSIEANNKLNLLHLIIRARNGSATTRRFLLYDMAKWSKKKVEDSELHIHNAESTIQIIEGAFK